jgi:hypothetical protein
MPVSLCSYRGRRSATIENEWLRVTVTQEGGHVAELFWKPAGVNPLWSPPWPTMEPSEYRRDLNPEYGDDAESRLLSGILGHNLCLDLWGSPSPEEAAAGMSVHGEAGVIPWTVASQEGVLSASCTLPAAQIRFSRTLRLQGARVLFEEEAENLSPLDRPIAWTQHVTLGPPFLERGRTRFALPAVRSRSYEGQEFVWPLDPSGRDLSVLKPAPVSEGFSSHLMDPAREDAWLVAWSPTYKLALRYTWTRADFPWLGYWEENHARQSPPWNGKTLAVGLEFAASPVPESRRTMIERGRLWGVQGYRWLAARETARVRFQAELFESELMPAVD